MGGVGSEAIRIEALTGNALLAVISDLAALRVNIFARFPYLYDGDADYEARYLNTYRESPGAIVVGAFDGERLIGAATGTPMLEHDDAFSGALAGLDLDLSRVFYCGESVLLPGYRGLGLGHRFFDEREAYARRLGASHCCFCAVIRLEDHPARPPDYRPLDAFWQKRGYRKLEGVVTSYRWKDIGESAETDKPMQFWMRAL